MIILNKKVEVETYGNVTSYSITIISDQPLKEKKYCLSVEGENLQVPMLRQERKTRLIPNREFDGYIEEEVFETRYLTHKR